MKIIKLLFLLFVLTGLGCQSLTLPPKEAAFVAKYGRTAMDLGHSYRLSPSVILACAMITSHADTLPAGNSFFQIPADHYDRCTIKYDTRLNKAYGTFYEAAADACSIAKGIMNGGDKDFIQMCSIAQQNCDGDKYIELVKLAIDAYDLDTLD